MDWHNELLLSCLGSSIQASTVSRLRNLADDDWDIMVALALKYGVASVLYSSLSQLPPAIRIPSKVRNSLRNSYHRTAARNMRVYQQLLRMLEAFRTKAVQVILLKGVHLAELVYGNIALRPMGDIDLLVRNGDLSKASSILETEDYEMSKEDVARSLEHLAPFRKKGYLDVEIHFNIAAPPVSNNFAVEELWDRARMEQIQGAQVLTLCPEDLLLHLCMHTTIHHCFDNGIRPFLDIHRTLDHYGPRIDMDEVMRRSIRWGVSSSVYVMLELTHRFLGTPVQPWTLETVTPGKPVFEVIETAQRLVFEVNHPVSINVVKLFGPGRWSDRLRVFLDRAFPPSELMVTSDLQNMTRLSIIKLYCFRLKGIFSRHWKSTWLALLDRKKNANVFETQMERNRLKEWFENG